MTSLIVKIVAGVVGLLVLVGVAAWVFGLGPFNTRPSAAARQLPKVAAAVAKTQTQAGAAVAQAETKTAATIAARDERTEDHVAKIRAAAPRAVPVAVPDREFYRSVCVSELYAGDPDCRSLGGEPEGRGPAAGAGAVRRR